MTHPDPDEQRANDELDALLARADAAVLAALDKEIDVPARLAELLEQAGLAPPYSENASPAGEGTDPRGNDHGDL